MLTTLARAVIQTIFFVSGIVTLVQTFVGDRLPIIQARPSSLSLHFGRAFLGG